MRVTTPTNESLKTSFHHPRRRLQQPPPMVLTCIDLSLLEAVEKSQNSVEVLDLKALKKLVLAFERRLKDNIEAGLMYPNQPDRFADSEIELHEELQKLKVLTGAPELYPDLVKLNVMPSIVDNNKMKWFITAKVTCHKCC